MWERRPPRQPRHRPSADSHRAPAERRTSRHRGLEGRRSGRGTTRGSWSWAVPPLPAGADAGRRTRSGNSDRTGAAGRGFGQRSCAVCGLRGRERPSWKLCMVRSAGLMVSNRHGLNKVAERPVCPPVCHPNKEEGPARLTRVACNLLKTLARPERLELPTSWSVARRSIQLSYGRANARRLELRWGAGCPTPRRRGHYREAAARRKACQGLSASPAKALESRGFPRFRLAEFWLVRPESIHYYRRPPVGDRGQSMLS